PAYAPRPVQRLRHGGGLRGRHRRTLGGGPTRYGSRRATTDADQPRPTPSPRRRRRRRGSRPGTIIAAKPESGARIRVLVLFPLRGSKAAREPCDRLRSLGSFPLSAQLGRMIFEFLTRCPAKRWSVQHPVNLRPKSSHAAQSV